MLFNTKKTVNLKRTLLYTLFCYLYFSSTNGLAECNGIFRVQKNTQHGSDYNQQ